MTVVVRLRVLYTFILFALSLSVAAQQQNTCWAVDNQEWPGNRRCPGSSACCGVDAVCMQNRLCKNKDQGENEFVRGPCAVAPYDKKKCAAICVYGEGDSFPRVTRCEDGSFCCDNDPDCCAAGRGTFLDEDGNIIGEPAETSSTDATSSSYPPAMTSTDAQGADKPDAETSDNGLGIKIGLGVGIPAAAIVLGLLFWYLRKKRRTNIQRGDDMDRPDLHQQQSQLHPSHLELDALNGSKTRPVLQELQG